MSHQMVSLVGVLALAGWAIYRQTVTRRVLDGLARFRLSVIYAVVGVVLLIINGWRPPHGTGWLFLGAGLLLSVTTGLARGRMTRVWAAPDGQHLRQGTPLTVGLFVATVLLKTGLNLLATALGVAAGAGAGEVLLVVAVMTALQAEIVYRRSIRLERVSTPGLAAEATRHRPPSLGGGASTERN